MKDELVYPHERSLGAITLVLGLMGWMLIVVGTVGLALVYLLFGFLFYLFAHSALISHLRGHAVLLTAQQLPDLRARFDACCARLGIDEPPEAWLLQGGGVLNAFATRFLGRHHIVLLSDIVDAMDDHPDGLNFYLGHELGHVRMRHLTGQLLRAPVLWLPLLGAAYSRAREYTCDRHGRACCDGGGSAARALVALAAGAERWKQVDLRAYASQAALSRGFWMSFHELTNGYPWLTKRLARVLDPAVTGPRRQPFAWLFALFVPYAGRAGGAAAGVLVLVAIVGILAAVGIPAYQDYTVRSRLSTVVPATQTTRDGLAAYWERSDGPPESLEAIGLASELSDGTELDLDVDTLVLTARTPKSGSLVFTPTREANGRLGWACSPGEGVKPGNAPPGCREPAPEPADLSK